MLDGFCGYNKIALQKKDQSKITFTTPWSTFMYVRIPFGLLNIATTFQREIDFEFVGEKNKFNVVYLDYLTIFSNSISLCNERK